jgi:predicted DNA binding CopG/RHH family protein
MSKKLPVFKSDRAAEKFLEQDLSDYLSADNLAPYPFEYRPKQKSVNLRISEELLSAVRPRRAGVAFLISAIFVRRWKLALRQHKAP